MQQRRKSIVLSIADFQLFRTLGTGTFGRVRLCRSVHNGRHFAIKIMHKLELVHLKQVEHTNSERNTLMHTVHPFIVNLWGTFQDTKYLYMVMDYIPGGELFNLLRTKKHFEPYLAQFYAAETLLALGYLHSWDIIYRDLKPENILLDRDGHIKLTDFGFAKTVPDRTYTMCGTPDYIAPEVIASRGYNKSVDYWALGILIYEMLAGYTPFHDENTIRIYEKIMRCQVQYPRHFGDDVQDLLIHLLTRDMGMRYGSLKRGHLDVMEHNWFSNIDFDVLAQRKIDPPYVPSVDSDGDSSCFDVYEETPMVLPNDDDPFRHYFKDF
ncbi:kinase-like domain-containing protein [Fennellomyces sp. T-0311]|nr:kinase-like domain-containing protein [Fennellomyces sp. T-0311]